MLRQEEGLIRQQVPPAASAHALAHSLGFRLLNHDAPHRVRQLLLGVLLNLRQQERHLLLHE